MPIIDIDSDTAREAAARELAGPAYPHDELRDRIIDWIIRFAGRFTGGDDQPANEHVGVGILIAVVLAVVVIAALAARRAMRSGGGARLYGAAAQSAAEHRTQSQRAAAEGDWDGAIRQRVRAIGRQLEEDGVLDPLPGRTAEEMARSAGLTLAELSTELATAASLFNDVSYGHRPGSESGYRLVADLDDRLRPAIAAVGPVPAS